MAKLTVTMPDGTITAARTAATTAGLSLSAWLDRAARDAIRHEGAQALADFMAGPDGDEFRETLQSMTVMRTALLDNFPELAA